MHSDMDHTVLPANYTTPAFTLQPQSITTLWLVLILPCAASGDILARGDLFDLCNSGESNGSWLALGLLAYSEVVSVLHS